MGAENRDFPVFAILFAIIYKKAVSPIPAKVSRILGNVAGFLLAAASISSLLAPAAPGLDAVRIAGGFNSPLFLTAPPGDSSRLFVVEQGGQIRIIDLTTRTVKPIPFLDLSAEVSFVGEEGLLGLAFDPNYAASGRF